MSQTINSIIHKEIQRNFTSLCICDCNGFSKLRMLCYTFEPAVSFAQKKNQSSLDHLMTQRNINNNLRKSLLMKCEKNDIIFRFFGSLNAVYFRRNLIELEPWVIKQSDYDEFRLRICSDQKANSFVFVQVTINYYVRSA